MTKRKKIQIGVGILLFILLITNPSLNNFKEFIGQKPNVRRSSNYLIFSIFNDNYSNKAYLGIIKNFYDITPPPSAEEKAAIEKSKIDSVANAAIIIENKRQDSMAKKISEDYEREKNIGLVKNKQN